MEEHYQPTRVLVTVMTYPLPSRGYQELVCTAGVTEQGEWARFYPVNYRYLPPHQQFHKYQWISIDLAPRGHRNDRRKESRKPLLESIRVGERVGTDHKWIARRMIIDRLPVFTVNELQSLYDKDRTSLGVVRPVKVVDLVIEEGEREWKPEWQLLYKQFTLFGPSQKPLAKIPFKFSFVFECGDSRRPHKHMIEDWELGVLYLRLATKLGDEKSAAEATRRTYLERTCGPGRDTRFFMGTTFPWKSWVVVGVFYPPKSQLGLQRPLFGATS